MLGWIWLTWRRLRARLLRWVLLLGILLRRVLLRRIGLTWRLLRRIRLTRRPLWRVGLHWIATRLLSRNGGRVGRSCRNRGRLLSQHETKDACQQQHTPGDQADDP